MSSNNSDVNNGRVKKDETQIKRRITQACILCRKKKVSITFLLPAK